MSLKKCHKCQFYTNSLCKNWWDLKSPYLKSIVKIICLSGLNITDFLSDVVGSKKKSYSNVLGIPSGNLTSNVGSNAHSATWKTKHFLGYLRQNYFPTCKQRAQGYKPCCTLLGEKDKQKKEHLWKVSNNKPTGPTASESPGLLHSPNILFMQRSWKVPGWQWW